MRSHAVVFSLMCWPGLRCITSWVSHFIKWLQSTATTWYSIAKQLQLSSWKQKYVYVFVWCAGCWRFLQNAVDLEVAKLNITDHTSLNTPHLRSQIRRRIFASTIPMRPWFPLVISIPELKIMMQDSLMVQRRLVSFMQKWLKLPICNDFWFAESTP